MLPVVWSAARDHGYGLAAVAIWLAFAPAKLLNLTQRKGLIDAGLDADFVLFDPDARRTVDAAKLQGVDVDDLFRGVAPGDAKRAAKRRAAASMYHGFECTGDVVATIVRGRLAYARGRFRDEPLGRVVTRGGDPLDARG